MSKYNKIQTLQKILAPGIVPVFYHGDISVCKEVVNACYQGGIRAFEFTNRGDGAYAIFTQLIAFVRENCPDMALGAGTILDAPTAAMYIAAGADFIVSPCTVPEVARLCGRRCIPYSPGCATPTEIFAALELGCEIIKVFPAGTVGGPDFVRNVLAPMPKLLLMCTGAVEPSESNLKAWAASGAAAVGMGSKLFPNEALGNGDYGSIADLCRKSIQWFSH